MNYFFAVYAVAVISGLIFVFWSGIKSIFTPNRSIVDAAEPTIPVKPSDSQRISAALDKWITETATELPANESCAEVQASEPVSQPPVETMEAGGQPVKIHTYLIADEPSVPFASNASENTGAKQPEPEEYNWQETFGAHTAAETNYYEILQISPNADMETIHRVYRIMASRFHPDNPRTGNVERFYVLSKAFEVLSNPAQRLAYDATYRLREQEPAQIFRVEDFVDGVKGEENRRLGVLSLLYNRRRIREDSPGLSLLELEQRMAVPREYLSFTIWYLRAKQYIRTQESNSDVMLTADGVDYVEKQFSTNHVIRELLTAGNEQEAIAPKSTDRDQVAA